MIKKLSIRNYAIIEELEIGFPRGLTIITGETGAGKSILLGALSLIMGGRADSKSLHDQSKKCIIEGVFEVDKYNLRSFFSENDLDYSSECIIRRELSPTGKSRAFVNDTPVNLSVLKKLTGALIDLHEQFGSLDIHNSSFQLRMIDALADNARLLEQYQRLYKKYTSDQKKLSQLIEQNNRSSQESDFLHFQLNEFKQTALLPGEQARLEAEQNQLVNAEQIKTNLSAAFHLLNEGQMPLTSQLREVLRQLTEVKQFHPQLPVLHQRLESLLVEMEDIASELEKVAEGTSFDPGRISSIQSRLDAIYRLQNKHRVKTIEELLDIQSDIENRLAAINDLSTEIATLENSLARQEKELRHIARQLAQRRRKSAPSFTKKVLNLLKQLAMPHTRFEVEFKELNNLTPAGTDEVHFLFAANPGSRLLPVKEVASGGELSRLTLVTKSLVAAAIPLPTLIFDEIDTGISGDVSLKMGNILRQLSNHHQVINITHSPQIAAQADAHYFVYKKVNGNTTTTNVKLLNEEERVRSIAVMLSQNPPTEAALTNARELMGPEKTV
ncbi:MAG TPA: DNA repair protein RecN [Bacteroidetes bacterium]|nr:DNA repair protein RecN [Bacteroidota bacterium]